MATGIVGLPLTNRASYSVSVVIAPLDRYDRQVSPSVQGGRGSNRKLGFGGIRSPGMHGNKEYAYSPDLPGHVVKCD